MKKISDDLQMLADHIANAKERLKIAEQGIKERMEASIHQSQGDAKARREAFMFRMKEEQADAAICFAMLVIDEVEVAALEAIHAEAYADSVTESEGRDE